MSKQRKLGKCELVSSGQKGFDAVSGDGTVDGNKVRRFKKAILRAGRYVHPKDNWEKDIATDDLHTYVAAFNAMRENGVDVEVVTDHSDSAKDVYGYLVDAFVEGDWLVGITEMRGDDAISLTERNKNVSVRLDPQYTDGEGRTYGESIAHVSISQQPIVSGQSGFEAIAASRAKDADTPILIQFNHDEEDDMKNFLSRLQKLLGVEKEFEGEDAALSAVESHTKKLNDDAKKLAADLAAAKDQAKALSANVDAKPDKMDARFLGLAAESVGDRIGRLAIDAESAKSLSAVLVGTEDNRNETMLAFASSPKESVAHQVLDVLEAIEFVPTGEQTGAQTLLSRQVPDGEGNTKPDPEETKRRGAYARSQISK